MSTIRKASDLLIVSFGVVPDGTIATIKEDHVKQLVCTPLRPYIEIGDNTYRFEGVEREGTSDILLLLLEDYTYRSFAVKLERDDAWKAVAMEGNIVGAVKRYREVHGTGLKEALDIVKEFRREMSCDATRQEPVTETATEEMMSWKELAECGQVFKAVIRYRAVEGGTISDACKVVGDYQRSLGK